MAVNDVAEQRAEDGSEVMCYTCGTSELVGTFFNVTSSMLRGSIRTKL